MPNRHEKLIAWVLEKSADEPLRKRIELLRGAAELIGDENEARRLRVIALDLLRADIRCREFAFRFGLDGDGDGKGDWR